MKKLYKSLLIAGAMLLGGAQLNAQCAWSATTGLHGYGCGVGDEIEDFELDGTNNPSGCSSNGYYTMYSSPVWNLTIGNTYTWSSVTGLSAGYTQGFALWIDLNNDGFFSSTEQMGNSGPGYTHSGTFTVPFTASPGSNVRLRIRCDYATSIGNTNTTACDIYGSPNYDFYYGETEDYNVNLIAPTPCSGVPGPNSVLGPTAAICPNSTAFLSLLNTYTVGDITYTWQASTSSSVGPFTSVPNATNSSYTTPPLNVPTWYQVLITCTNVSGVTTASPGLVLVQPTTTNTVPYHENFEGIAKNNDMPNCSWTAQNVGTQAFTYIGANTDGRQSCSGNKFASFYYSPAGTKNFYSNGIFMRSGVTYSASLWYRTEYYGYANWTDLSIYVGPNQNATGQFKVASTNGPAVSPICKPLSNTFTVPQTGIYYVNVKATSSTSQYAYYLSWDELDIMIPCQLNTPSVAVTGTNTICQGAQVALSASGAHTYTWSTGSNLTTLSDAPVASTNYYVVGTNTNSGCSVQVNYPVTVNPSPEVNIFTTKSAICEGESVSLTAFGADTYLWDNTTTNNVRVVNPTSSTTYQVYGTNSYNCTTMAQQLITVFPAPAISGSADRTAICAGEAVRLTGTGGVSYTWASPYGFTQANPAVSYIPASATFTVTGKDANGCTNTFQVPVSVDACVGVSEHASALGIRVFPNPNAGLFTVQVAGKAEVTVTDLSGKLVAAVNGENTVELNISKFANGIYNLKVVTANGSEVIKIVKE